MLNLDIAVSVVHSFHPWNVQVGVAVILKDLHLGGTLSNSQLNCLLAILTEVFCDSPVTP